MTWQEYQEAVGILYEQMAEIGAVSKNIMIPDKVTGQNRQIDVWWEIPLGNHTFKVLVDAKKRNSKVDVKDVEEIEMLANAVSADKAIIVTNSEWTEPAKTRADFSGLDLRILTIDEATGLVVEDKWLLCPNCEEDCVILDETGFIQMDDGLINWWLGGKCRECKTLVIHCQDCGHRDKILPHESWVCFCPLRWTNEEEGISIENVEISDDENEDLHDDPNQLKFEFPSENQ